LNPAASRWTAVSDNYLLDTNIAIALFAGEPSILDHLKDVMEVYIPSVVIGELYYGAHKSSQANQNLRRIETFIASNSILACDAVTAFHYGSIKDQLRQKGIVKLFNRKTVPVIISRLLITLTERFHSQIKLIGFPLFAGSSCVVF